MDIRKPFLKSFTVKELIQFIDHYIEHREILHVLEHPWEVCDLVARFLGFGYSRRWSEDEIAVLSENFTPLGAEETSKLLPMRTAYDCKRKADYLGLCTNVKTSQKRMLSYGTFMSWIFSQNIIQSSDKRLWFFCQAEQKPPAPAGQKNWGYPLNRRNSGLRRNCKL